LLFDDYALVDRVRLALQELFEKHVMMSQMGLHIGGNETLDPFQASHLLTAAFEFTWQVGRCARAPNMILMNPKQLPVMAMKEEFIMREGFFEDLQTVLPDFLSSKSNRAPMSRARWKELWATDPASFSAMEQQLAKLVEQALWAMAVDPAYALPEATPVDEWQQQLVDALSADSVPFEPWMISESSTRSQASDSKKKKKKRRAANSTSSPHLQLTVEEEEPLDEEDGCMQVQELKREEVTPGCGIPSSSASAKTEDPQGVKLESGAGDDEPQSSTTVADGASQHDDWLLPEPHESECDDADVGVGIFHNMVEVASSASELSREPTAASTPAAPDPALKMSGRKQTRPATPPCSPMSPRQAMHPPQLVCYVWSQSSGLDSYSSRFSGTPAQTPLSSTASATQTPFSRGQWTSASATPAGGAQGTPVAMAVVRKTFVDIDIDTPGWRTPVRSSRSLSPSFMATS